jgi:hypothetical protein
VIPILNSEHSFPKMKKNERLENKKRKTAALAKIIEINENDKIKSKKAIRNEKDSSDCEKKIDTGPETVSSTKRMI